MVSDKKKICTDLDLFHSVNQYMVSPSQESCLNVCTSPPDNICTLYIFLMWFFSAVSTFSISKEKVKKKGFYIYNMVVILWKTWFSYCWVARYFWKKDGLVKGRKKERGKRQYDDMCGFDGIGLNWLKKEDGKRLVRKGEEREKRKCHHLNNSSV